MPTLPLARLAHRASHVLLGWMLAAAPTVAPTLAPTLPRTLAATLPPTLVPALPRTLLPSVPPTLAPIAVCCERAARCEPSLRALLDAATRTARVEPERVASWERRLRASPLLPSVRVRVGRGYGAL